MKCEVALEYVSDYAAGRAAPPLRVVLDHHFAECGPCSQELASARELMQLFRDLPVVAPPAGFRAQVLARVADLPAPRRTPWWDRLTVPVAGRRVPVAGIAAAVLAVGLLFTQNSLHNAWTLGPNPTLRFPGTGSADVAFPFASELLVAGTPGPSHPRKAVTVNLLFQPASDLTNGRVILPRLTDGIQCENSTTASDRGQIVWQGSLPAGQLLKLPLHFRVTGDAVQRVLLYVEGDRRSFQRLLLIPGSPAEETTDDTIAGVFSTSDTLDRLAQRFGVVIATDLSHERAMPTALDASRPGRAIAQIAAQRGMLWTDSDGVFNVYTSRKTR